MKRIFAILLLTLCCASAFAQVDRHDVRAGNRKFKKGDIAASEIDYRKAVLKDSTSLAAQYNLASALYREEDYDGAGQALGAVAEAAGDADTFYNSGDVAVQKQDWAAAVKAYRESLLRNPDDIDAKENYIYAKKKLEDQQQQGDGGGGGGDGQNDQDNQDNQDNQDQNGQDNQDQNQQQQDDKDDQSGQQPREQQISPQQAQQMLKAIQAMEKETQDKVNKEKAEALQSRQKEKNW